MPPGVDIFAPGRGSPAPRAINGYGFPPLPSRRTRQLFDLTDAVFHPGSIFDGPGARGRPPGGEIRGMPPRISKSERKSTKSHPSSVVVLVVVVVRRRRPFSASGGPGPGPSSSSSICGFWDCRRRCRFSAFGGPPSRLLASRGHGAVGRRRDRRPLRFLPFLRPPGAARGGAGEHAVRGRPRRAAPPGRARAPLRPPRPMRRARGIGEAKNMRGEGRR